MFFQLFDLLLLFFFFLLDGPQLYFFHLLFIILFVLILNKFFPKLILISHSKLLLSNNRNSDNCFLKSNIIEHSSPTFYFISEIFFLFTNQSFKNVQHIICCYKFWSDILLFTKLDKLSKTYCIFLPIIFK